MKEKLEEILSRYADVFGYCEFSRVEKYLIKCRNIEKIPKNAKNIIVVLFPYYLGEEAYENSNVSRYAVVPDYHTVANIYLEKMTEKLKNAFPGEEFMYFADNSPIPEVTTASAAGVGFIGRNGLLINEKYGSWVFIGEIVTTLDFPANSRELTYCNGCGKCIEACPTGVLGDEIFDADKCLSCITQKKGENIPDEYVELMKKYNCAWGCDQCQKACPYNVNARKTYIEEFNNGQIPNVTPGVDVYGRAFAWRGEKVINRNLELMNKEEL